MPRVTYNRIDKIREDIQRISTDHGFVSINKSTFLGQILESIRAAFSREFQSAYDILNDIDIGRASGSGLERWGNLLGEPREHLTYATDLTLTNTYIHLDPEISAGEITTDGQGILIKRGAIISSSTMGASVQTIDDVYIRPDRSGAFTRVISNSPGEILIPPESLDTINVSIHDLPNISFPTAERHDIAVTNLETIQGGTEYANDDTYKYILLQRTNSIGLYNESRVNTIMDIPDIVEISIRVQQGSIYIFIDTAHPDMLENMVTIARRVVKDRWVKGYPISVYPALTRRVKMKINTTVTDEEIVDMLNAEFVDSIVDSITATRMGETINISDIVESAMSPLDNMVNARLLKCSYNGRVLTGHILSQQHNERAIISAEDIQII